MAITTKQAVTRCFVSLSPQLVHTKSRVSRVAASEMSGAVTEMGCCCDANGSVSSWEALTRLAAPRWSITYLCISHHRI